MKQLVKKLGGVLWIVLGMLMAFPGKQAFSEEISGDIFGRRTGIIHPFLGLTETYSDNMTNAHANETSDYLTVISPGIALALPGTGSTDIQMNSATAAPGGLFLTRRKLATTNRFQGLAVYNPEIDLYRDHSEENFTAQRAAGEFQYNAPGGLSIDIADKYQYAQEVWGETGTSIDHAKYADNGTHALVDFAFSPKLSLTAGGSAYALTYKQDEEKFRDRDDRGYFGDLNFQIASKTKLFCEYRRVNISYDKNFADDRDSAEDFFSVGVDWDITAKSQGLCKLGYVTKNYDDSAKKDPSTWCGELSINHQFTDRTMVTASAVREYYESNVAGSDYYTTNRVSLAYTQAFTRKLFASILLGYQKDDYNGVSIQNDTWTVMPSLGFSPYRWLTCRLAYNRSERNSDEDTWEYTTNAYTFSVTASF